MLTRTRDGWVSRRSAGTGGRPTRRRAVSTPATRVTTYACGVPIASTSRPDTAAADADAEHDAGAGQRQPLGQARRRRQHLDQPERADQRRRDHEPGDEREHAEHRRATARTGTPAPSAGPARPAGAAAAAAASSAAAAPYAMPATMLPAALSARSTPATPGCPRCWAKAIVTTSNDPKTPPERSPSRRPRRGPRGRSARTGRRRSPAPAGGGSVLRCTSSSVLPDDEQDDRDEHRLGRPDRERDPRHQRRPEDEDDLVDDRLQRERRLQLGRPVSAADQRARTSAPMLGQVAPATAADREQRPGRRVGRRELRQEHRCATRADGDHRGHRARLAVPVDEPVDSSGCPTASASADTAATAPARPYRCDVDETSSTIAMPSIEIGSRATNAAAENAGPPRTSQQTRRTGSARRRT